jgi:hypothetical protein
MAQEFEKHVRFYFEVTVSCLIPPIPRQQRKGVSSHEWERNFLDRVTEDLKVKMVSLGSDVAYREHAALDSVARIYTARFIVSALHPFPVTQIFLVKMGSKFRLSKTGFTKAKHNLEKKVAGLLENDYVVTAIVYKYAASRCFTFEVYMEGHLGLKHVISAAEINDANGSIRGAIEAFNTEVIEYFETGNFELYPRAGQRRPKDNIYWFDIFAARAFCFYEHEVHGEMAQLEQDMPHTEAILLGIDCDDDVLARAVSGELDGLEWHCSNFNLGADVIDFSLEFIDYDEDFLDYDDDLIQTPRR